MEYSEPCAEATIACEQAPGWVLGGVISLSLQLRLIPTLTSLEVLLFSRGLRAFLGLSFSDSEGVLEVIF